jgi:hypothetical protein
MVFLPMRDTLNGFIMDTTESGFRVTLPTSGYCLMVFGKISEWKEK